MGVRAGGIFGAVLMALCGPFATAALASGPVGTDPSTNFQIGALPQACQTDPTGVVCIDASVGYLNQARASLGQPPYALPADFASLTPAQQALILTNSDRVLYNLPPITGLTDALDGDAAAGVTSDSDPTPSTSDWYGYTSNAAWGDANMVLAYEGWMYDDGLGSDNVDCTASDTSGCWGHRHDILWQFDAGALAMGAAAGTDSSGNRSFTMLLVQGSPSFNPVYTYTWAQALADGAPTSSASSTTPAPSAGSSRAGDSPAAPVASGARVGLRIDRLRVRGHRITITISLPSGAPVRCSLTRLHGRLRRARRCGRLVTFAHLPAGRYRLRIGSGAGIVSRRVLVR
jgi:hypothetical protein